MTGWCKRLFGLKSLWLCGLALSVSAAVCPAAWKWYRIQFPVHEFSEVVPGVLYRSGQPEGSEWSILFDRYGIRTVVDLRHERETPTPREEAAWCRAHGVRFVHIPVGATELTKDQLDTLLETVANPDCQPVLVHCQYGKSRTGVAIAAYRIAAQGWSLERALEESYKFRDEMQPGYVAYLRSLASE